MNAPVISSNLDTIINLLVFKNSSQPIGLLILEFLLSWTPCKPVLVHNLMRTQMPSHMQFS